MRDSFIFYRSFFESFEGLSKKDRLILFEAVCNYALNDIEPELNGISLAIFKLLKPQLDANIRRYENGCKGGRPKKTETKPRQNLTKTKAKPNNNDNDNDNHNLNDNDNHNHNHNHNGLGSSRGGGGASDGDEFNIWKKLDGAGIDAIYDAYPESGGFLIEEVAAEVRNNRRTVDNAVGYVLGYAKRVGWDDNADHFDGGGMS